MDTKNICLVISLLATPAFAVIKVSHNPCDAIAGNWIGTWHNYGPYTGNCTWQVQATAERDDNAVRIDVSFASVNRRHCKDFQLTLDGNCIGGRLELMGAGNVGSLFGTIMGNKITLNNDGNSVNLNKVNFDQESKIISIENVFLVMGY